MARRGDDYWRESDISRRPREPGRGPLCDLGQDEPAVGGGVAPGPRERPGPLQEEVEVALPRVADGAVDLQGHPGGQVGGVGRHRLGHGRVVGERRLRRGERPGGAVGGGPGELERDPGVGQVVLDGLEAADRLAELVALLGVGGGHGDHAVGQADRAARRCPAAARSASSDTAASAATP